MTAFRLSLALALLTFGLLVVGGTVNPTGSSLACPDWPLCYGEVFPEMEGGILYEHTHRLVATLVGLVTCFLAAALWRRRDDGRSLRAWGLLLVAMVAVQGVLGGLTVIYKLPTLVSTAHLGLSMIFFLAVVETGFRLRPAPRAGAASSLVLLALAATYLQIVLGGLVRHAGAGRACGTEFPLCAGEVWPALPQAQLHQLHRGVGFVLALLVASAALAGWRRAAAARQRGALWAAALAPVLVVMQVVLGVVTVTSNIGVWQVTAHTGVAALLLADLYVLQRLLRRSAGETAPAASRSLGGPVQTGATS